MEPLETFDRPIGLVKCFHESTPYWLSSDHWLLSNNRGSSMPLCQYLHLHWPRTRKQNVTEWVGLNLPRLDWGLWHDRNNEFKTATSLTRMLLKHLHCTKNFKYYLKKPFKSWEYFKSWEIIYPNENLQHNWRTESTGLSGIHVKPSTETVAKGMDRWTALRLVVWFSVRDKIE